MKSTMTCPSCRKLLIVSSFNFFLLMSRLSCAEDEVVFTNWHYSIDVGGQVQTIYRPRNNVAFQNNSQSIDFLGGLQQLQDIIGQVPGGKRIRAYGSKWSMSDIAFVNDILIETWGLNYYSIGIDNPNHVSIKYRAKSDMLVFAQAGIMVKHLTEILEKNERSLITTGGSDGQRLVGAISTGTHGSSPHISGMSDFVRGIHIVTSATEHFFIQKETDPVVTQAYTNEFLNGATLVESDDLFEAVVVGLGSFGVIHAFLIEVEPLYVLCTQFKVVRYDDVKNDIASLNDVGVIGFDGITEIPHWFSFTINPYNRKAHVGAAEKIPARESCISSSSMTFTYSTGIEKVDPRIFQNETLIEDPATILLRVAADELTWLQSLDRNFRGIFRPIGNVLKRITFSKVLTIGLRVYSGNIERNSGKTHGTIFQQAGSGNERQPSPIPSTEMEIAVPLERASEAIEIFLEIAQRRPILQTVNVRFVKGSNATLSFTPFSTTVTISMFGMWSKLLFNDVEDIYYEIMAAMAATTIPHCWHWGKKQPPTSDWIVDSCYGVARRDAWIQQREAFLPDPATRNMFSSASLEFLGLHT